MTDEELVEGAQGAKAELNGGAAEVMAAQEPQIGAEIIALKLFPNRLLLPLFVMPARELVEGVAVVALGVSGSAAVSGEVLEKFCDRGHVARP